MGMSLRGRWFAKKDLPDATPARFRLNPEWPQSVTRLVVVLAVLFYSLVSGSQPLFNGAVIYLVISLLFLGWIVLSPAANHLRRAFMGLGDISVVTACLYYADGEEGTLFVGLFLWIITGYTFRYGVKYAYLTTTLAVAGFSAVVYLNPFWAMHPHMVAGNLLLILVVPVFMGHLIQKLHLAIAKAEEASRAKSAFLANMSHELRTPLNGIIGMSDMLVMTDLNKTQQEYAALIQSSAHTLLALIEDILDISKIEAGKLVSETKPFDLHELIAATVKTFRPQAKKRGVDLISRVDPLLPFRLVGDELHLRQVLMNLLSNAVKFTEAGYIELIAELADGRPDDELWIRFRVIDTGIGLSEAAQQRIFEGFVQADASVTRKYGGTGLGTTISKELVTLLNGTIGLVSEEGKGSEFWFELPFERQPDAPKMSIAAVSFADVRVLALLSEQLLPKVETPLRRWGQEMEHVPSVVRLFSKLVEANEAHRPFHVVLVEGEMLGMSAEQFVESMRAEAWLTDVALILVDSRLNAAALDSLIQRGYASILYTPLNESLLFNAIHEVCAAKQLSSEVVSVADYHRKNDAARALNILVAEDHEVNQAVIRALLERAGHQVVIAEDGEAALDQLADHGENFDMVLLDMNMPNLSGLEVLKAFRFLETGDHLPIVMLSANAMSDSISESLDAGADDYLTKPIDHGKLMATIDRLTQPEKAKGNGSVVQVFPVMAPAAAPAVVWRYIDVTPLEELQAFAVREGFVEELIGKFMVTGQTQIVELEQAAAAADIHRFQNIVHALKGSGGTLGAKVIYDICSELETQHSLTAIEMTSGYRRLANAFAESRKELEQYQNNRIA